MKPGSKKGQTHKSPHGGAGKNLAVTTGTPLSEWERAKDLGIEFPASGIPDEDAMAQVLGLSRDMLDDRRRLR